MVARLASHVKIINTTKDKDTIVEPFLLERRHVHIAVAVRLTCQREEQRRMLVCLSPSYSKPSKVYVKM